MDIARETIAVTGGYGFLGKHVCRELQLRGASVHPIARGRYDLRRSTDVQAMYWDIKPSILIHLAATVGGIGYNAAHPIEMLNDNLLMGIHLIEYAAAAGVRKFVQVGTPCSYPQYTPYPTREEELWRGYPVPVTAPYGVAKLVLLPMLQLQHVAGRLEMAYLIPSNLYGPGDHFAPDRSHVIPALVRRFVEAKRAGSPTVTIWGTGAAGRDFLYVEDAARAVADVTARICTPDPINLGSGLCIAIATVAGVIARLVGYTGQVVWDASKPDGYMRRALDTRRAAALFGFAPQTPLEQGLVATIKDYTHATTR